MYKLWVTHELIYCLIDLNIYCNINKNRNLMKPIQLLSILFLCLFSCIEPKKENTNYLFLWQQAPGDTPVMFKLPPDSGMFVGERIAISNDFKEIYYGDRDNYPAKISEIKALRFIDGKWQGPFHLFPDYGGPALSVDGKKLILGNKIAERVNEDWSSLKLFTKYPYGLHYLQETNSGTYYVSTEPITGGEGGFDWSKMIVNGNDTIFQSLGRPLNNSSNQGDFYIAKDESYIISANDTESGRPMFISYFINGKWTNPKSLGPKINKNQYNWGTYVSPDNKFLFFSTVTQSDYSDAGVFWVRIDNIIDSLKHTNYSPYVLNDIPDQVTSLDKKFTYSIPDSIFFDDDKNDLLIFSVEVVLGSKLIDSLEFDNQVISFEPVKTGNLKMRIIASDEANESVYDEFDIVININENEK